MPHSPSIYALTQDYAITNLCKSKSCIEPLCPQCITAHVKLHQENGSPAEIENIVTRRVKCIERIAQLKFDAQGELNKVQKGITEALDDLIQQIRQRFQLGKARILKEVQEKLDEKESKVEVLLAAYEADRDIKQKDSEQKASPYQQYVNTLTNYKNELESDEYIPALIQILNNPPKQPATLQKPQIQDFGSIRLNESAIFQLRKTIDSIMEVEVKASENKINFNRQNFHASNHMKFSRTQLDKSVRSDSQNSQVSSQRAKSKSRIFGEKNANTSIINESIVETRTHSNEPRLQIKPVSLGTNRQSTFKSTLDSPSLPSLTVRINSDIKSANFASQSYFVNDEGVLAYFLPGTQVLMKASTRFPQAGFEKVELQSEKMIPQKHATVITNKGHIYLIGGLRLGHYLAECAYVVGSKLVSTPNMGIPRGNSSCCYSRGQLFVFGGYGPGSKLLQNCERYDLAVGQWSPLCPMLEPSCGFTVSPMGTTILKFGGLLNNCQSLQRIDIYDLLSDNWSVVEVPQGFPMQLGMGCAELSAKEVMVFGGIDHRGEGSASCFLLELEDRTLQLSPCESLYSPGAFSQAFATRQGVLAVQSSTNNRSHSILCYRQGRWRFVWC